MKDYIQEVIDDSGEDFSELVASPAACWLFTVAVARKLKE